ncbi:hyaluronoglucosaminidase [Dysgonomonadaceae bacterium PH5-43]|nr:hyaluronoglucosaminidase [Dysgonomonadaceae bacterium PH5-43]
MKRKLLLSLITLLLCTGTSLAQIVTVSPIPHSIAWGDEAFVNTTTYSIKGESDADKDAIDLLKTSVSVDTGNVEIIIGEKGDEAISDYETLIPEKKEGYYLKVESNKVIIAGYDGSGTYYGVQTFLQIASQPKVMQVTITDYPDVADRGVVEGFYGNPWSQKDRLRQFDFYGKNKMNVYIYGPKDDPYHRGKWRQNYPAAEAALLQELVVAAHKNKVQFVWAVHPGNDIKWNNADSLNVVKKLNSMYDLGIRTFAVFFDDIGGEGTSGIKQAQLMNYINAEFVKKHDDVAPLIICPTQYNRGWSSGDYLSILGTEMDADVRIMWTGNSVVDMINKGDMTWINNQIKRNAYIWLNYPVNDYCIDRMLMGPTYGNDKDISDQLSGFTSNPMEYAEASKVSLYSIADYSWNMGDYDENASWERAIKYLMPKNSEAFRVFCENNIDLGSTGHGLRRANESATFKAAANIFETAIADGYNEDAIKNMTLQFDTLVNASVALLNDTNEPEMVAEITPWVQVMKYIGERGLKLMDMFTALNNENKEAFIELYKEISALELAQKSVIARNFEGSIKKPNPTVAGEVVSPFLKKQLANLIREYKSKYDYMLDVFPPELIEEGRYYIKYNGKYLTNVNANPDKTGDYPVFKTEEDVINPQRQEWTISMDMETERYKIVNTQDGRYINELGNFWANKTNNPYEAAWHSYNIYRLNGKYAIQNAGSAGKKFWTSNGTRINQGSATEIKAANFVFEIIPVGDETVEHPVIEDLGLYYIEYDGKVLENTNPKGNGGTPMFKDKLTEVNNKQLWIFTLDKTTGRYSLKSAQDSRYVNEIGNFGVNAYSNEWNTYVLTEMGGLFSIQNADKSGTNFWEVSEDRMQKGNAGRKDSYIFKITLGKDLTGINYPDSSLNYYIDGSNLNINSLSAIDSIRLFNAEGKLLKEKKNSDVISIKGLDKNVYILSVTDKDSQKNFKVQLP